MSKLIIFLFIILNYNTSSATMKNKPYHHLPDGTFRNPEGSPMRSEKIKFSYSAPNLKFPMDSSAPRGHRLIFRRDNKHRPKIWQPSH